METEGIIREVTPLTQSDCFTIFSRVKSEFNFPLHYHDEYELNLILNAAGAKRVVGDHMETIKDLELVLIGPNMPHAWFNDCCVSDSITEITIQWHKDLLDENFLNRNQLHMLKNMLNRSKRGLSFSVDIIEKIKPQILSLEKNTGFESVLNLLLILQELAISPDTRSLASSTEFESGNTYYSRRIDKVFDYMNKNYQSAISLKEMAKMCHMTEVSFSRFMKKRTGNTFVDTLNNIRLGHASRMLIETSLTIAEISYFTGFNNISNFNRIFKKKKGSTPSEFRLNHQYSRKFI